MKLPPFEYVCPTTVEEAVALLVSHNGEARPLAGGQSLIPMMAFRIARPTLLVDLRKLTSLNQITVRTDGITLGAMVRWRDIQHDKRLTTANPLLQTAISHVAHYQIRNRGTVGGSLCHADPAAEMPGIAITCDAEMVVVGKRGRRSIKANDFFVGLMTTSLEPDEILVELRFPGWPPNRRFAFQEMSLRQGDFAIAGVAIFYDVGLDGKAFNAHVGVIGIGDKQHRLPLTECAINGSTVDEATIYRAAAIAAEETSPQDDIHASAAYRTSLIEVLVERALKVASTGTA
jgi:carbon-monoxide dehydrogenase medium subunit